MKRITQSLAMVIAAFSLVVACDEVESPDVGEGAGGAMEGQQPGDDPGAEEPGAELPVEDPPVEEPPVEDPVEPPVEEPPVEEPPVEEPPVEDPELALNDEIIGLLFVREEEKLARDVYMHLADVWGVQTFSSIVPSEQSHMDAVLGHLVALGVDDPAEGNEPGVFTDIELQGLYDDLIEQGEVSATAALEVGAFIEEFDILDLIMRAADAESQAVIDTYGRLEAGSENHLRAFVRGLSGQGVDYVPLLMDQAAYDAIIAGGGGGGGPGGGGGGGRR
jgi:hypothetical protein